MGQLEKYGLYVLCLVIFLILGVTIWGGGEPPAPSRLQPPPAASSMNAAPVKSAAARLGDGRSLDSLLRPVVGADETRPPGPRPEVRAAEASAPVTAATPAAQPQPQDPPKAAPGTTRPTYVVQKNDTFEGIAKTRLGSAALRLEIERLNPGVRPERLRPGQQIVLPSAAELQARGATAVAAAPSSADAPRDGVARTYTVRKGDTFERIARVQLGSQQRTRELLDLNPDVKAEELRIGQRIKLPAK